MTISIRHKRVWLFRTLPADGELTAVSDRLLERGTATECALDLAVAGSNSGPATGPTIAALLHIYDPIGWSRQDSAALCRSLGGVEYGVSERLVFDRSLAGDGSAPDAPELRIGTQHRRLDSGAFSHHWWHRHAPLVQRHMIGVARYAQSYVNWAANGAQPLDGFFESSLLHPGVLADGLYDSPEGEALLEADGEAYADGSRSERITVRRTRLLPDHQTFDKARMARP